MSLQLAAQHLASRGRGNDSMLVHMTPSEIQNLQELALAHGGSLTINPDTGLPEAGFLSNLLKAVVPMALGAWLGPAGASLGGGFFSSALGAGAAVGLGTAAVTGDLGKGLMAGFGAYGGFGLGEGLMGAGSAALGTSALDAAKTAALEQGLTGESYNKFLQEAVAKQMGEASIFDKLGSGVTKAAMDPRVSIVDSMGGLKNAAKYGMAAATPFLADQMVETTTDMPQLRNQSAYLRPFEYDRDTMRFTELPPTKLAEGGKTDAKEDIGPGKKFDIQKAYKELFERAVQKEEAARTEDPNMTPEMALQYLKQNPGISDREVAQYMREYNVPYKSIAQAAGIQPSQAKQRYENASSPFYRLSGKSQDAYNYLMGLGPYSKRGAATPEVTTTTEKVTTPEVTTGREKITTIEKVTIPEKITIPDETTLEEETTTEGTTVDYETTTEGEDETTTEGEDKTTTVEDETTTEGETTTEEDETTTEGETTTEEDETTTEGETTTEEDETTTEGETTTEEDETTVESETTTGEDETTVEEETTVENVTTVEDYTTIEEDVTTEWWTEGTTGGEDFTTGTETVTGDDGTFPVTTAGEDGTDPTVTLPGDGTDPTVTLPDDGLPDTTLPGDSTLPGVTTGGIGDGDDGVDPDALAAYLASLAGTTTDTTTGTTGTTGNDSLLTPDEIAGLESTLGGLGGTTTVDTAGGTTGGTTTVDTAGGTAGGTTTVDTAGGTTGTDLISDTQNFLDTAGSTTGGSTVIDDGTSGVVSDTIGPRIGVPNVTIEGNGINEFYTYPELGGSTSLQDQAGGVGSVDASGGFSPGTLTPAASDTGTVGGSSVDTSAVIDSIGDILGGRSDFAGSGFGGGKGNVDDLDWGEMLVAKGGLLRPRTINGLSDLGSYSDGGRLLRGPGDGVSDSIPAVIGNKQPARLADGEFVIPARIVSELGNGSTEAGARKLYAMMDRIQATRKSSTGKGNVARNTRADKHLPA